MSKPKKKVVITGRCALQNELHEWIAKFETNGYEVIGSPIPDVDLPYPDKFNKLYLDFYSTIPKADIYFLMNEDSKGVKGYIGGGASPELGFALGQKIINHQNLDIYVLKIPEKSVLQYEEINIWRDLGWLKIWEENPLFN